jgi:hypothetical protein
VFDAADDREGFSADAAQFDSDITEGRYPRAALGVADEWLVAVACDGRRSNVDGGLSMLELAQVMVELGAESAINLDFQFAWRSRPIFRPSSSCRDWDRDRSSRRVCWARRERWRGSRGWDHTPPTAEAYSARSSWPDSV